MIREVLKYVTQGNWEINCSIKAECGTEWKLEELCSRGSICRVAVVEDHCAPL